MFGWGKGGVGGAEGVRRGGGGRGKLGRWAGDKGGASGWGRANRFRIETFKNGMTSKKTKRAMSGEILVSNLLYGMEDGRNGLGVGRRGKESVGRESRVGGGGGDAWRARGEGVGRIRHGDPDATHRLPILFVVL